MNLQRAYLIAAVVGAIGPYVFFIQHFTESGFALAGFTAAVFANPAASGFAVDLLISSAVFWLFVFRESAAHGIRRPWVFVAINLLIGLSCALPLFLYVRERAK